MTKAQIASMIDHTLLKAAATPQQITELCETAKALHTASVCVNPCHVALAAAQGQRRKGMHGHRLSFGSQHHRRQGL